MTKNIFLLIIMVSCASCVQNEKNFITKDLIGQWIMYSGEVIIDGQTYENPSTMGELIGFEFFKDNTGLTTNHPVRFDWELTNDNRLISRRDSVIWDYSIKYKSSTEIDFIEKKDDRVFVWKMRKK